MNNQDYIIVLILSGVSLYLLYKTYNNSRKIIKIENETTDLLNEVKILLSGNNKNITTNEKVIENEEIEEKEEIEDISLGSLVENDLEVILPNTGNIMCFDNIMNNIINEELNNDVDIEEISINEEPIVEKPIIEEKIIIKTFKSTKKRAELVIYETSDGKFIRFGEKINPFPSELNNKRILLKDCLKVFS